jgi:hypothetical protein
MTLNRERIETLVTDVQQLFLEAPVLRLRPWQVARRIGIDVGTCREILQVLVDAHVLTLTPARAYARLFPRRDSAVARRGPARAA